jgi:O-antigen/teichoic acid export membrane protein
MIKYSSRKTIGELFHFGKYSMGTSMGANLFGVTDTLFINFFLGPATLAVYNLGMKFIQIVEIPMLSFAASGMPSMASYYNNNQLENMMALMKKLVGMLTLAFAGIALFFIAFAEPLIRIAGGDKYVHTAAPNILRIVITIGIAFPIDRFFAMTLDVIHKPKINFYKILVMLAINVIGDFIGVLFFKSIYAIAIVNLFPLLAAIIMAYIPLNRFYRFSLWGVFATGASEVIQLVKQARLKLARA